MYKRQGGSDVDAHGTAGHDRSAVEGAAEANAVDGGAVHDRGGDACRTVEQLAGAELRFVGNAVDAVDNQVPLGLVGLQLIGAEHGRVGAGHGQGSAFAQQAADFIQRAFGGLGVVDGILVVADGLGDAPDLGAEILAADQTGRIIGGANNAQAGAEAVDGLTEGLTGLAQIAQGGHRGRVGVDAKRHVVSSLKAIPARTSPFVRLRMPCWLVKGCLPGNPTRYT